MMAQDEVQDYGYNTRDELISGQGLTYNYDDIGNRVVAEGKTYTANSLNQYTAIDTFEPQYDADGNQTLIKTSTGIWAVTYNAENRPVRWERGDTIVTMDFDRMGRRVFYKEEVADVVTKHHKFVYDNYLCVQKLDALNDNSQINLFVWDPTEPVATRPLFMLSNLGSYKFFYTFDGNKNVSELVHFESRNGIAAHYDYAPFGAVTRAVNTSTISARNFHLENPFRFSSEYHDDTLGLVYYNYRHYNPTDGRWFSRDLIDDFNLYLICVNTALNEFDLLGMKSFSPFTFNRLLDGKLSQPFDMPSAEGSGMAGSVSRYSYLDDHNNMTNSVYNIEAVVNTNSALIAYPCCLMNGERGIRYEVRPFAATNRKSFFVDPACKDFSNKNTTEAHEEIHSKHAEDCFLKSTKILQSMSSECIVERCDSIRKKIIDIALKKAVLKRDYLDVKLHYEDNKGPFVPAQAKLEKHWRAWKNAEKEFDNARMEMVKCKLKQ